MKKQKKNIIGKIIFFIVFSLFIYNPFSIEARTTTTLTDVYSNPNNGPLTDYSFDLKNIINTNLLTQVVGCTGVVDKVSEWMVMLPTKLTGKLKDKAEDALYEELQNACNSLKAGTEAGAGSVVQVNNLVATVKTLFSKITGKIGGNTAEICSDKVITSDLPLYKKNAALLVEEQKNKMVTECFNGIAITLAKNQLTAMTRSTMNWVNTGFGGNPFYVQNVSGYMNRLERNVIETGIDSLLTPGKTSPYAENFIKTTINSKGLTRSSTEMLGGLYSTLGNFVTDPLSYYKDETLERAGETRNALIEAEKANEIFAKNFSSGGWDAWMALTQLPQNNPLGYNIMASQIISDQVQKQQEEKQNELLRNGGFLNQEKCVLWGLKDEKGNPKWNEIKNNNGKTEYEGSTSTTQPQKEEDGGCIKWETITPGSLIKDKVSNYLTSPERQLELADTINEGLNALFSILLEKLQLSGLSGLADAPVETSNWVDDLNSGESSSYSYSNGGSYNNFNLTRDLGNTYYHLNKAEIKDLGTWNADTNIATNKNGTTEKLYAGKAPQYALAIDETGKKKNKEIYMFYTVKTAGKSKIINDGYNGWAEEDRAFWDGNEWQNWKCKADNKGECTNQKNPLKKKGVVQTQKDFIVAAKDLIGLLPNVTTSLAKLDYCIPGPNPSYKLNSTDIRSAYQDWIGSMYVGPRDQYRTEWRIDHEDSRTYKNLAEYYSDTPNIWKELNKLDNTKRSDNFMWLLDNFDRRWGDEGLFDGREVVERSWWKFFIPIAGPIWAAKSLLDQGVNCTNNNYCCIANLNDTNLGANLYAFENYKDRVCLSYHYDKDGDYNKSESWSIENRKTIMNTWLDYVNNGLFTNFFEVFDKMMNVKYYNNITKQYFENEATTIKTKNPDYIPMAEMGLSYVKNIAYYDEVTEETIEEYKNAILETQTNIAKLESIKNKVSAIITEAQNTRNQKLKDKADKEGLTLDKYLEKYASCMAEENISFFDIDDIMVSTGTKEERCNDGIDNDLDRLVDKDDPDCVGVETSPILNLPNKEEICGNNIDDNENNKIDEGCRMTVVNN